MKLTPIILLFLLVLTGCYHNKAVEATLRDAEILMESHPDSAYAILQTIDPTTIKSEQQCALYALLYSQALDKNYIDETNDSLISIATDYYESGSDIRHRMLAHYYMARILYNNTYYPQSLSAFMRAEEDAKYLNDNYYLSNIYFYLSEIHNKTYSNIESLNYARLSYEKIRMTNITEMKDWSLFDLGRAYHNCNDYNKSISISKQVIDSAIAHNNQHLLLKAHQLAATSNAAIQNHKKTISHLCAIKTIDSTTFEPSDYSFLGNAYLSVGKIDSAIICMKNLQIIDSSDLWLSYLINRHIGNYQKALNSLEHENKKTDSIFKLIINQRVFEAAANYHKKELYIQKSKLKQERKLNIIYCISIFVFIVFAIIIFRLNSIKRKKDIENNILIAQNLRQMLKIKTEQTEEMQNAINSLFESKYETLDELCNIYYDSQITNNKEIKIYGTITSLINSFRTDPKVFTKLEECVNRYQNNMMSEFRNSFPKTKESDLKLFLYTVVGFSPRAISLLINEDINIVYSRKHRLKNKIKNSTSPRKDIFLGFLE